MKTSGLIERTLRTIGSRLISPNPTPDQMIRAAPKTGGTAERPGKEELRS